MVKYVFEINGKDFSGFVERDSYVTDAQIVYSRKVTTLDMVDHVVPIRVKGSITVGLNPQSAADTAFICTELLKAPIVVRYFCLKRQKVINAMMLADGASVQYLSRCLYRGEDWNEIGTITLEEL